MYRLAERALKFGELDCAERFFLKSTSLMRQSNDDNAFYADMGIALLMLAQSYFAKGYRETSLRLFLERMEMFEQVEEVQKGYWNKTMSLSFAQMGFFSQHNFVLHESIELHSRLCEDELKSLGLPKLLLDFGKPIISSLSVIFRTALK